MALCFRVQIGATGTTMWRSSLWTYGALVPIRLVSLLLFRGPRLVASAIFYFLNGPRQPSWSFSMHVSVEALRQFLSSNLEISVWKLEADQALSSLPEPLRSGCRVRNRGCTVPVHPEALHFFKGKMMGQFPGAADIPHSPPCEWIECSDETLDSGTVLMLHGGGFVLGSPQSHRWLSCGIAARTRMRVLGEDPREIRLLGDSAGGGLCLSLLLALKHGGWPMPRNAALLSPWVDLTLSSPSLSLNESFDYLVDGSLQGYAQMYAPGRESQNPYASPLLASDLSGLCPILIQVGGSEGLLDEGAALHKALVESDGAQRHRLQVFAEMPHVFQCLPTDGQAADALGKLSVWMSSSD